MFSGTKTPLELVVASGGGSPPEEDDMPLYVGLEANFSIRNNPDATKWLELLGQEISRVTYANLFDELAPEETGTTSSGTATITGLTDANLWCRPGAEVESSAFPSGAVVLTVDSATQVTVDQNATSTGSVAVRFFCRAGVGDGSTTFTLENAAGRVTISAGSGALASTVYPGQTDGTEDVTLTIGQTPQHAHSLGDNANEELDGGSSVTGAITGGIFSQNPADARSGPSTTGTQGGGLPHTNMQPWRATRTFICFAV